MKAELKNGNIVITIPANTQDPPLSSSQKTRLVASASAKPDGLLVQGKQLTITLNAYIKA